MTKENNSTLPAISNERQKRVLAEQRYGSWENFLNKTALLEQEKEIRKRYYEKSREVRDEESLVRLMDYRMPYWMSPTVLAELDMTMLGAPEGSKEWTDIVNKVDLRTRRLPEDLESAARSRSHAAMFGVELEVANEPFYQDYTTMGWPGNCGTPVRFVTPEEHREIERRLKSGRLTKPGANVANVSQTLAEMLEEDITQPPWIIEGLLREGGAMMVYGPSGIGKTWFVHTLMLLASHGASAGVWDAEGQRWVLRAGEQKGLRVALIDGEMTRADIVERDRVLCGAVSPSVGTIGLTPSGSIGAIPPIDLEQLKLALRNEPEGVLALVERHEQRRPSKKQEPERGAKKTGCKGTEGGDGGLCVDLSKIDVHAKSAQDPGATFVDLSDTEWRQTILSYVKATGTRVAIFDNLSTLCPSLEDENAAAEWSPLNDLVVSLKRENVATILVHHSGKAGSLGKAGSYRGSSNLVTTLETVVSLQAVESGEVTCTDARFKVVVEKSRTGRIPLVNDRVLRLTEGKWIVEVDEHSMGERLVRIIKSLRYRTQKEAGAAIGLNPVQTTRVLGVAVGSGKVTREEITECLRRAREINDNPEKFSPVELGDNLSGALDI